MPAPLPISSLCSPQMLEMSKGGAAAESSSEATTKLGRGGEIKNRVAMSPPNSCIEVLTANVMVFGDGAPGR